MKIKHSKFKNTGILFELLVRQITADTLKGGDSPAIDLLKNYFVKSELGREYKLYESILKSKVLNESRANMFVDTILESSKKFNRSLLRKQKYNLINEIKDHYNLEEFFKTKLPHYKSQAAIYTLIEATGDNKKQSHEQIINNKLVLLEHLTSSIKKIDKPKEDVMNEFSQYDKGTRILTYKILLEKFNTKYSDFSTNKKLILKEFINSVDNTDKLKVFYNTKINEMKSELVSLNKKTKNQVTKIKINEVATFLVGLEKNDKVNNEHIVNLLQYCDLLEELQQANGK